MEALHLPLHCNAPLERLLHFPVRFEFAAGVKEKLDSKRASWPLPRQSKVWMRLALSCVARESSGALFAVLRAVTNPSGLINRVSHSPDPESFVSGSEIIAPVRVAAFTCTVEARVGAARSIMTFLDYDQGLIFPQTSRARREREYDPSGRSFTRKIFTGVMGLR